MNPVLVFLGFGVFLTCALGMLASGIDRKVTARLQYRVGPPLWQPFIDLVKFFGKENLVPRGAVRALFFGAPLFGLASVFAVSTILWMNAVDPAQSFGGDLIVVLYFLVMPSISLMMGGFASRNPYASLGASREMKLILAYELPFLLSMMVPVMKAGMHIRLGEILLHQAEAGATIGSVSGALAFIVGLLTIQAKLGLVPFDIAEAESEIVSGPLIEYSGVGLGLFRLMKITLLFVLPFFLVILYMGGISWHGWGLLWSFLKFLSVVVLIVVIRNTNPRVRIDQAVRFFWGPVTGLAALAVGLAWAGW